MAENKQESYRVLARKYRPDNFSEVVGQDALIRTLRNAINSGRIHHAYMLTGIRGTGKTTTARLIARALNYAGPDGTAGPTTGPTNDCEICQAIAAGRHPDVLEMDAASRTGVDDIRDITDGVRYAPTSARYKVYIIDEVHMLSRQAFNALLKTLEEPPPHVIFIFATTEIRKVPVTVLSRCQRFDLRRVDAATLTDYYGQIAEKEKVEADKDALALMARAADGSVRDGLSLLDQAIALAGDKVTLQQIQDMLGLSDSGRVLDILEFVLKGDCPAALDALGELYRSGGDPTVLVQDMLDFTHLITRARAVPKAEANDAAISPDIKERIDALASKLSMPTLGRAWQILLKGLAEVNTAPNPQAAAEMLVIRLSYAADLPDPADLIKKLQDGTSDISGSPATAPPAERTPAPVARKAASGNGQQYSQAIATPNPQTGEEPKAVISSLKQLEEVLTIHQFYQLAGEVYQYVHLVRLEEGRLEFRPAPEARPELASELGKALHKMTGTRWMVSVSGASGAKTMAEAREEAEAARLAEAKAHPVVAKVLEIFPGTEVSIVEDVE